jgi:hypothetical protein
MIVSIFTDEETEAQTIAKGRHTYRESLPIVKSSIYPLN